MATRFAAQQFGEAFLTTLTQTRRLKQERDLFAQGQATLNRRITLLDIFRQGIIAEGQARERRQIETQKFDQQLATINLGLEGVTETTTSRFNPRTQRQEGTRGEGDISDVFQLGERSLLLPAPEEEQFSIERTETLDVDGKPVIFGVDDAGNLKRIGKKFIKSTTQDVAGTELTDKGKIALDNLLNPKLNLEDDFIDPLTGKSRIERKSDKQIKAEFSANVNQIANDVFKDSRMINWFIRLKRTNNGKFPNPRDLIAKGEEELTKEQQAKLVTFLHFYGLFFNIISQEGF